jgi:hypothetical protein
MSGDIFEVDNHVRVAIPVGYDKRLAEGTTGRVIEKIA